MEENKLSFPRLCGVLAESPTRLSQAMHNAGYRALGLDFVYVAFRSTDTEAGIRAMRELGFRGLSLTMPHKERALGLVDELSDAVRSIKAINTVINDGATLVGENTDWMGILAAFSEARVELKGRLVLVFGAGGASRAALYALKHQEAGEVIIVNRSFDRAQALSTEFGVTACRVEAVHEVLLGGVEVFINASPVGSLDAPGASFPFKPDDLSKVPVVFDMVTTPTELTKLSHKGGKTTIEGSRMLLFQALEQFKLFTGVDSAPREAMEQALQAELRRSKPR